MFPIVRGYILWVEMAQNNNSSREKKPTEEAFNLEWRNWAHDRTEPLSTTITHIYTRVNSNLGNPTFNKYVSPTTPPKHTFCRFVQHNPFFLCCYFFPFQFSKIKQTNRPSLSTHFSVVVLITEWKIDWTWVLITSHSPPADIEPSLDGMFAEKISYSLR